MDPYPLELLAGGARTDPATSVKTRWLVTRDLRQLLTIERASFPDPWSGRDFSRTIGPPHAAGRVAEVQPGGPETPWVILGYSIFDLEDGRFHLLNLAVAPDCRRRGVGTLLVRELLARLHPGRPRIECVVSESNLAAQLWLRALSFRAVQVLRKHHQNGEDGYLFRAELTGV